MADFALPDHMIVWIEGQLDLGRAPNIATYLAGLVAEDRRVQQRLDARKAAIAEARASGISMQPSDSFLAHWLSQTDRAADTRLRAAIRQGRESGYSHASLDGILARALMTDGAHDRAQAA